MVTDRNYLRAERDYLTPPEDRDPVCDHCEEVELHDLDNADALVTAALGCAPDAALCPRCRDIGAADAAKLAAEEAARIADGIALLNADVALTKLAAQWQNRSGLRTYAHLVSVEMARLDATHGDALGDGWVAL